MINEFNPKTKWYKMFNLEQFVRTFAESYMNTYTMAFVAACREIYDKEDHRGFESEAAAEEFYKQQAAGKIPEANNIEDSTENVAELIGNPNYVEARGNTRVGPKLIRHNYFIAFGCRPSQGVLAETKMIKNVIDILDSLYARHN